MSDLLTLAAVFSLYPVVVLLVAITGPHSRHEREDNAKAHLQEHAA